MSNKVPGQSEKWDDVIRQLTSVWTPESAARVLAAIAQLDLQGSSTIGDVPTFNGTKFVPQPGGSGWSLANSRDLAAGESSWSFSLPASGKTHARLLVRVNVTPAHEFGIGIRLNGDTTLSHYAGGDADPTATGLGASWRVLLPSGAAATGLLTIDLPFYRLLPLLGLQGVARPAGGGLPDQVYWNGATPAATVTLLAMENTDDNYAAFAARVVDGGVAELWLA